MEETSDEESLNKQQKCDLLAWSSFIQQRGQALLDLYLYVSSNNYWDTISPAYAKILPWYANYIIPPARRAAATARTKHLGIRSLDLDNVEEYAAGEEIRPGFQPDAAAPSFAANKSSPEQLLNRQKSLNWLRKQTHSDTFQLHQLTNEFFGPLEKLLGDKKYLLTENRPSSLDSLALGYLALMLYMPVTHQWLADALKQRYPKLTKYTQRMYKQTFKDPNKRWQERVSPASPPTVSDGIKHMGQSILNYAFPTLKHDITPDASAENARSQTAQSTSLLSSFPVQTALLSASAIAGLAFAATKFTSASSSSRGETVFTQERDYLQPSRLSDMGEAGAAFAAAFGRGPEVESQFEREKERVGGATIVEVDVEGENGGVGRQVIMSK
jgi:sorting and assembly machinery component 37